jgi:hypothetical protein
VWEVEEKAESKFQRPGKHKLHFPNEISLCFTRQEAVFTISLFVMIDLTTFMAQHLFSSSFLALPPDPITTFHQL